MTKFRAKISILSKLLSFPLSNQRDWNSDFFNKDIQVGDLVSLNCAPPSKWYVSWVREIECKYRGYERYLLESVEDGELCWWTNVGISVYSREIVKQHPEWKWNNKQFAFNDRWNKVFSRNDAFWVLPTWPYFDNGNLVTLNVRIRYGLDGFENPKTFSNWKKLTMKEMEEYYRECVGKYEKEKG